MLSYKCTEHFFIIKTCITETLLIISIQILLATHIVKKLLIPFITQSHKFLSTFIKCFEKFINIINLMKLKPLQHQMSDQLKAYEST